MKELVKPNLLEDEQIPVNFYSECSGRDTRFCDSGGTNISLHDEDEILF